MRCAVLAVIVLAAGVGRAAAPADRGDLAVQARAIFLKHCAECHGPDKPRGDLPLLNYTKITTGDWAVPIVNTARPDDSLLLQLVEDGSMPPADRPKLTADEVKTLENWVRAQAPGYPERFDEKFALNAILADVERRGPQAGSVRYVSLYHLLADDAHPHAPGPYRAALRRALAAWKAPAEALQPIEPTATVLRLDLSAARLDQVPFKWVRTAADGTTSVRAADDFNLFDLILLEYPFGRLLGQTPPEQRLAEEFLRPAKQVRPVIYVRGDWLASVLTTGPLADDLRKLLKVAGPEPAKPPPLVATPVIGTPILPLDSIAVSDSAPEREPYQLTFQVIDAKTDRPRDRFKPGNLVFLDGQAATNVFLEVFMKPSRGNLSVVIGQAQQKGPTRKIHLGVTENGKIAPFEVNQDLGKQRLIVFACEDRFPPGEILRGPDEIERIVHRFYSLGPAQGSLDSARVEKKTVTFDVQK